MTPILMSVLIAVAPALLGYGVVRWLRAPWPPAAQVGAGMVLGPPLTSLLLFGTSELGAGLHSWVAWTIAGSGLVLCGAAIWRAPAPSPQRAGATIAPIVGAAVVAGVLALQLLAYPAPRGDGFAHFDTKARFFIADDGPWLFLEDPETFALHNDYPLHQPYLMDFGYLFADDLKGLYSLAGSWLMVPGAVLFLGSLAASAGSAIAGLLLAAFAALAPGLRMYASAGYADPHVGAILAVAAGGVAVGGRGPVIAGLAAGLMVWVKLEGAVHLCVLGAAVVLLRPWPVRAAVRWVVVAMATAAIWPATVYLRGAGIALGEGVPQSPPGERAQLILESFGSSIGHPESKFHLLLLAALIGAIGAVLTGPRRIAGRAGAILLAAVAAEMTINFLRAPALHLQADVARRLLVQVFPFALFVLAMQLDSALRSRAALRPTGAEHSKTAIPREPFEGSSAS